LIYAYTINNSGTIKANGGKGGNGVTSGSLQSGNGGTAGVSGVSMDYKI
jgi:hypothetical protein